VRAMTAALRALFVPFFYLIVSSFTLQSFLTHWGGKLASELSSTLAFSEPRPYAYRVLSPLVVNGVTALLPQSWTSALLESWGHGVLGLAVSRAGCFGPPTFAFLVDTWWMLGGLWATALVWRALVRWAFPGRALLADAVPALGILMLPATFTGGGFLYDFADLFFVSACFWAFVQSKWAVWYALLPLAILNKEASVLVVTWWLAVRGTTPKRAWLGHVTASTLLGGAVVAGLWWTFRARAGFLAQPNFLHNLRYWASFGWLFASQDGFGTAVPLPVAFNVVNLAVLWSAWSIGRPRAPQPVVRAFSWSALVVCPLLLLFGFENEIRVFTVAMPSLLVIGAGAVDSLYGSQPPPGPPSIPA
jgi:hypothetical protein